MGFFVNEEATFFAKYGFVVLDDQADGTHYWMKQGKKLRDMLEIEEANVGFPEYFSVTMMRVCFGR